MQSEDGVPNALPALLLLPLLLLLLLPLLLLLLLAPLSVIITFSS